MAYVASAVMIVPHAIIRNASNVVAAFVRVFALGLTFVTARADVGPLAILLVMVSVKSAYKSMEFMAVEAWKTLKAATRGKFVVMASLNISADVNILMKIVMLKRNATVCCAKSVSMVVRTAPQGVLLTQIVMLATVKFAVKSRVRLLCTNV